MNLLKKRVKKFFRMTGYTKEPKRSKYHKIAVELTSNDVEIIKYVIDQGFTMASQSRLVNTLKSCRYVVENNIPGDFVECGVWRGGNGILAKKMFEALGSDKQVWMFDTFEGMTEPTDFDVSALSKVKAETKYRQTLNESHSEWAYASIEDVKNNCKSSSIDFGGLKFVKGDVCQTLNDPDNIPSAISVLRLDTDWYESTKSELEVLYPILSTKGVLIIDDYGHWEGSRRAVDEYFSEQKYKPLFNAIDYSGRSAIKA
jgi:hypothetical protein